jgi:hypothetical protein
MMTHALNVLAAARAALVTTSEKASAAHEAHTQLLTRLSEAQARGAEAIRDVRAGTLDEATGSMRKAIADADSVDVQTLIDASAALLAAINDEHARAVAKSAAAETAARNEELQQGANAMDQKIKELESLFLSAVAERARIHKAMNPRATPGSTFTFYQASQALDSLVRQNVSALA